VTSVSVVSANGLAGTVATATTTPAITLSTTVTGVVKGNGTALSAAVAATDYVAPSAYASANGLTMATARLLGRTTAATGAAEEISVAGGLTLSGGTLTGTSGTVTSVTGTAPVVSSGGATPAISMAAATTSVNGYLTSTDWTTFNNKGSGTVTSVAQSFTGGLISVAGSPITTSGTLALTVAGTSGGIPYFSSGTTWATSAALTASALVVGGGAGAAPATTTTGTGVVTALGVAVGSAGAFVVNGGALGTPSSGTVTNLTGTASININGTVGATTAAAGKFTTLGVTALITSTLTSGEVMKFGSPSAGTGIIYMDMFNTSGGMYLGIEGSAGGSLWTNIPSVCNRTWWKKWWRGDLVQCQCY
jgi:trimeric autotransporter adhesin